MIGFYTKFTTTEEYRDVLVQILSKAATLMQSNVDCIEYVVNKDLTNTAVTWITEIWTSKEAQQMSLSIQGAKELITQAMPLLMSKPEQIQLSIVGGKGLQLSFNNVRDSMHRK